MVTLVLHAAANDGIVWLSKPPTTVLKQVGLLGPVYMVSGTRDNPPPELPWAS